MLGEGAGLGHVDVRELTPKNQELFLKAVEGRLRGPEGAGAGRLGIAGLLAVLARQVRGPRENARMRKKG